MPQSGLASPDSGEGCRGISQDLAQMVAQHPLPSLSAGVLQAMEQTTEIKCNSWTTTNTIFSEELRWNQSEAWLVKSLQGDQAEVQCF